MKVITTIATSLVLALGGVFIGVGTAEAAPRSAVVLPKKATLLADGSLRLTMKVRCNRQQQAFEWSVDVRQGAVYGNDYAGPTAGLITCDGRFHTVRARVVGANGPYKVGCARVQALVQLFDEVEGSDVELEDREVVRIRR